MAGGVSPGIDTPCCMHAGAKVLASRTPRHDGTGCGARQRRWPTGGSANGMPRYTSMPSSLFPAKAPLSVFTTAAGVAGAACPHAPTSNSNAAHHLHAVLFIFVSRRFVSGQCRLPRSVTPDRPVTFPPRLITFAVAAIAARIGHMMISADPAQTRQPAWLRPHAWAMLFWLAFLLVLEPGNILRAAQDGQTLSLSHEALRIVLAAMLGTTVTSTVQMLVERFPLRGAARGRHLLIHAASAAGLALALVLTSCLLAAWVFAEQWLPSWDEIWDQLVGNFTLLMFALGALIALFQARPWRTPSSSSSAPSALPAASP